MKKELLVIFTLAALGPVMGATPEPKKLDLSAFSISPQVSSTTEVGTCAFNQKKILVEAVNVPADIALREKNYTAGWLEMDREFYPPSSNILAEMAVVRNVQDRDDGIIMSYGPESGDWWVKVIDGRRMEYMIYNKAFQGRDVPAVFRKAVHKMNPDPGKLELVESHSLDAAKSYGAMTLSIAWGRDEWTRRIEWYRDGNTVLFIFPKESPKQASKNPFVDATKFFGGIPPTDNRPYLRFEHSNRAELAKEYLARREASRKAGGLDAPSNPNSDAGTFTGGPLKP